VPEILVRGAAEVRAMPDRATVRATIDGEGDTREAAYEAASRAAADVDAVLEAEADALDRVTTAALIVQPRTRWRKGESLRTGWRAARTTVVEVADLGRIGTVVARLTGAGAAIAGPTWELDRDHEAHDRARRLAAEDARRRADAYAAGVGLRVSSVLWVSEPGLRLSSDGHGLPAAMPVAVRAFAGGGEVADGDTIEVAPAEIVVAAVVEVGFEALAG
jgi:hypothetical protein